MAMQLHCKASYVHRVPRRSIIARAGFSAPTQSLRDTKALDLVYAKNASGGPEWLQVIEDWNTDSNSVLCAWKGQVLRLHQKEGAADGIWSTARIGKAHLGSPIRDAA